MQRFLARSLAAAALCLLTACASSGTTRSSGRSAAGPAAPSTAAPAPTAATTVVAPATTAAPNRERPAHTMVIVLENREYSDVIGNPDAPFINDLARRYGSATNLFAVSHPSLPNYLELLAGQTFGIGSDCTSCSVEGDTLVDQLDRQGISWAAFMDGMPAPCFTGASAGRAYAKKHNPFVYVRHIVADPTMCGRVQPSANLSGALASAAPPAFVWLTPNMCDDGHDCPLATTDNWLRGEIEAVQATPWYRDGGLVIVTWDEGTSGASCCGQAFGGHIATLLVGDHVKPGSRVDGPVSQAGILATIEDRYGVPRLGDAACPCAGTLTALVV